MNATTAPPAPDSAAVLAALIHHGLATQPPDVLPPEWQAAYSAVRSLPAGTLRHKAKRR